MAGVLRQIEKFLPLVVLAPVIDFAVVLDVVAALAVVADSRKKTRLGLVDHRPKIQIYRLSCLPVAVTVERNPAVGRAKVFTIGDDRVMVGERDCRVSVAVGEL